MCKAWGFVVVGGLAYQAKARNFACIGSVPAVRPFRPQHVRTSTWVCHSRAISSRRIPAGRRTMSHPHRRPAPSAFSVGPVLFGTHALCRPVIGTVHDPAPRAPIGVWEPNKVHECWFVLARLGGPLDRANEDCIGPPVAAFLGRLQLDPKMFTAPASASVGFSQLPGMPVYACHAGCDPPVSFSPPANPRAQPD